MEREGAGLLDRSEAPAVQSSAAESVRPPAGAVPEPVLFWAERDPDVAFRGWALLTALALPIGLLAPGAVLLVAAATALATWLNLKAFRLEVTPRTLRFRPGLLGGMRSWPLAAVGAVEVRDEELRPVRWGRDPPASGHVLIELPEGLLGIPGLKEPVELADAIERIRRGLLRPP